MYQYGTCPKESPKLPLWARQLRRRTVLSKEVLVRIPAKAKSELPRLAAIPKAWCAAVVCILLASMFVVALQYAGLTEIQYELNRRQSELASLNKKKVELELQVEQLSSLERVEKEARTLGMIYPVERQVVRVATRSSDGERVAYSGVQSKNK